MKTKIRSYDDEDTDFHARKIHEAGSRIRIITDDLKFSSDEPDEFDV